MKKCLFIVLAFALLGLPDAEGTSPQFNAAYAQKKGGDKKEDKKKDPPGPPVVKDKKDKKPPPDKPKRHESDG